MRLYMNTNTDMVTSTSIKKDIDFTDEICADGICCFLSIPKGQNHLGIWKSFLKRGNASHGIKLLYSGIQVKDVICNPCKCLDFYLKEVSNANGVNLQVLLRCTIYGKKCRPYTCNEFPDKANSFMHDIPAPCIYNEYIASKEYIKLKHKHVFRLYYAIKDDPGLLNRIFPNHSGEETRKKLNEYYNLVKICAIWDGKQSEYFILEVPRSNSVLHISKEHPKIESIAQAYNQWQGHIEGWLEKNYGVNWEKHLEQAIKQEEDRLESVKTLK